MANVSLKTDFKDGNKLFATELNNNFKVIKAAIDSNDSDLEKVIEDAENRLQKELEQITADRGWDWGGSAPDRATFYKNGTEQVNSKEVVNGQLLVDTETGEIFLDNDGKRISAGSGSVVQVGGNKPTNTATKIWFPDDTIKTKASEVINSMDGNETDLSPSVNAVKGYIKNENSLIYCKKQKDLELSLNYQNIEDWEEIYNLGDAFELAKGIVKVKKANHVRVKSKLRISATGTPMFYSYIIKNGSNIKTSWVIQGARADCTLINEAIVEVAEGDTLTCSIYGDSGTSLKEDATTFIVEKID